MKFSTLKLDNDMEVLTVSDERFIKSSASVAVMAGSMQNPDEHLGLAHFLEHMLFLGTKDYPEVGDYENFLNKNGGGHNAYTSIDHTNYFFDVDHKGFEGALKRFSRFFVCPTFDEKYVEREKNAVHSEHEKNLQEDGRREYRFLQLITDPQHPFSKFATGDIKTLGNADRHVVLDFYKKHYSSNLMKLVLMSNKDDEELKELAVSYFSDIKNTQLSQPQYDEKLFSHLSLPQIHQVETIRDKEVLKLSFSTPDETPYWESKPVGFLAHLIGDEGEGSLLSYLKQEGFAMGLETSTWWRMFHIRVTLTEKGRREYKKVMQAVFSYIKLLQNEGLKDYIFHERKVLAELELQNIEPTSSMSRASQFSASMLFYPTEHFLDHHYLYHKHSQEDFQTFLDCLVTSNLQVTLLSNQQIKASVEPYYQIHYKSEDLPSDFVESLESVEVLPQLTYPKPNAYLPDDLKLVSAPECQPPQETVQQETLHFFSQIDNELEIPRSYLSLSFISNKIAGDPKRYLLAKLFCRAKKEELNEWSYPSQIAGLNYGLSHGYNTITLDVSGYSQHCNKLLNNLILDPKTKRQLNKVQLRPELFEQMKEKYRKALENKNHDAAYQQLLFEQSYFFSSSAIHWEDYVGLVDKITLDEINQFAKDFFSEVSIRSFSYGNCEPNQMQDSVNLFFDEIGSKVLNKEQLSQLENKYVKLSGQSLLAQFKRQNNNNAQLSFYVVDDWSIENQAYVSLVAKLLEQSYFTELRTHQQLGYIVAAFPSVGLGFAGIGTLIQSDQYTAGDIFTRSHKFICETLENLARDVTEEDIKMIKTSLINDITRKPNSMGERVSRFTSLGGTYHGDFKFYDKLAARVGQLNKDKVIQFVNDHMSDFQSSSVLTLLFHSESNSKLTALEGADEIKDIEGFKKLSPKIHPYKTSHSQT